MYILSEIKKCIYKYADFRGRSSRSEFFVFHIFYLCLIFLPLFIGENYKNIATIFIITAFFVLITPMIAVSVRRLHDSNHSGWWLLAWPIPLIGFIVVFPMMFYKGDANENEYGAAP